MKPKAHTDIAARMLGKGPTQLGPCPCCGTPLSGHTSAGEVCSSDEAEDGIGAFTMCVYCTNFLAVIPAPTETGYGLRRATEEEERMLREAPAFKGKEALIERIRARHPYKKKFS